MHKLNKMLYWLRKHGIQLASKLVVWSLVWSILLASLPIPIAVVSHGTDEANTPYPCRDGKCGCKSAFQCWTSCCCHTAQERLDWAAKNGVAIPEYGQHLKQVAASERATQAAKPACCQKIKPVAPVAKAACCEVKVKDVQAATKPRTRVVLSMFALGCRGSIGELASLPWAIVVVAASNAWMIGPFTHMLVVLDTQGPTQFYPPELPPPRLS